MTEEEKIKLGSEVAIGVEYQGAWDRMVKPFFDKKKAELYAVFQNCPVRDKDALVEIHAQHLALTALENEFKERITTGKMAQHQLAEAEEPQKEKNDE